MNILYEAIGYVPYQYDVKQKTIGFFKSEDEANKAVTYFHNEHKQRAMGGSLVKGKVVERVVFHNVEEYIEYEQGKVIKDILCKLSDEEKLVLRNAGILKENR